jgi:hypothetical protein
MGNQVLGRLIGSRLCSVQFVYDYVQLRFDASGQDQPFLPCDAMPTVIVDGRSYADGQPGYADVLHSLIAATRGRRQ